MEMQIQLFIFRYLLNVQPVITSFLSFYVYAPIRLLEKINLKWQSRSDDTRYGSLRSKFEHTHSDSMCLAIEWMNWYCSLRVKTCNALRDMPTATTSVFSLSPQKRCVGPCVSSIQVSIPAFNYNRWMKWTKRGENEPHLWVMRNQIRSVKTENELAAIPPKKNVNKNSEWIECGVQTSFSLLPFAEYRGHVWKVHQQPTSSPSSKPNINRSPDHHFRTTARAHTERHCCFKRIFTIKNLRFTLMMMIGSVGSAT